MGVLYASWYCTGTFTISGIFSSGRMMNKALTNLSWRLPTDDTFQHQCFPDANVFQRGDQNSSDQQNIEPN